MEFSYLPGARAVFSGHAHRNQQSGARDPTIFVTAATGRASRESPPAIRVVTVSDGELEIEILELAPELAAAESEAGGP